MLDSPQNTSTIKTGEKAGQTSNFHQNLVNIKSRKGVAYSIPCHDCNKRYIGETKRRLETRQKEYKADV